jgi:hypothetical protein
MEVMMERILLVATVVGVALVFLVIHSLRRDRIRVEYSISWLAAACVLLFLARWPLALEWLGGRIGVASPAAVLLAMAVGLFAVVLFRMSVTISHLRDNNIELAQKVAILEYHIEQLRTDANRN